MKRLTLITAAALLLSAAPVRAESTFADLTMLSTNGTGSIVAASPCLEPDGGEGSGGRYESAHFRYSGAITGSPLPLASAFEQLIDMTLVHEFFGLAGFLEPAGSTFTIDTPRGQVFGSLSAGQCNQLAISFDDSTGPGNGHGAGEWTITGGTGSYTAAVGSGPFDIQLRLSPAANNPLRIDMRGDVAVPSPAFGVTMPRVFYATIPDLLLGQPTAQFEVTNTGGGDAYNVVLETVPSAPATTIDDPRAAIGTLASGRTATVAVRFRVDRTLCAVVLCDFNVDTTVRSTDALDVQTRAVTQTFVVPGTAL